MSSKTVGTLYSSMKLSDMRPYIFEANVPYLILASHQVHDVVDTWSYHAQCNITPFEFELPQYGINIDIKYFNSEFYRGIVNRQNPETTLHYIQGVIGSVFSLRLAKVIRIPCEEEDESDLFDNVSNEVEKLRRKRDSSGFIDSAKSRMVDWFNQLHSFMDRSFFIKRTPEILNFARGHDDIQRFELNPHYIPKEGEDPTTTLEGLSPSEDTTLLVDGGLLVNVPTNPVLRPQRATDILFVFDFAHSGEEISEHWVLQKAVKLARMGGLKFPPIHIDKIKEEPWREFYIFEDADDSECPIVFYFYPCTEKFKRLKTYESSRKNRDKNVTYWEGFTDFDVMDSDTYGMTNSDYSDVDFERLRELMWFNVIINVEVMKRKIKDKILQKRTLKQQQSG
uniref:cytosolic phospholipase A2 zeta-like n=1 Tax=Styela clava TaxID=7725 RepID=UPI00193A75F0|nr:cytosolic phospholipase A2 zeta-like [Styela clava]